MSRIQVDTLEPRTQPCDLAIIVRKAVENRRQIQPTRPIQHEGLGMSAEKQRRERRQLHWTMVTRAASILGRVERDTNPRTFRSTVFKFAWIHSSIVHYGRWPQAPAGAVFLA